MFDAAVLQRIERMKQMKDGGPAFPQPLAVGPNGIYPPDEQGMSLRDYFAAKAMAASMMGNYQGQEPPPPVIAGWAYAQADAMLVERAKVKS